MLKNENQEELVGKPVTLEYLPTSRSKKWRKSFMVQRYVPELHNITALRCIENNEWYKVRFVLYKT
jgi:hypothetical protein